MFGIQKDIKTKIIKVEPQRSCTKGSKAQIDVKEGDVECLMGLAIMSSLNLTKPLTALLGNEAADSRKTARIDQ